MPLKELNIQDSKSPETNGPEINGSNPRGRGRPPFEFGPETERRLLRLFLKSRAPLERITRIITNLGGPNRLRVRAFFEKLTGAGRDSGLALRDFRPQNGKEQVRATTGDTATEQAVTQDKCSSCRDAEQEVVALEVHKTLPPEDAPSVGSRWQHHAGETISEEALRADLSQPGWHIEQQMPLTCEASWWNSNLGLEDSRQMETEVERSTGSDAGLQQPHTIETSTMLNSSAHEFSSINESSKACERISPPVRPASRAERCGKKAFHWTKIALGLDGGSPGRYFHIVKCCSILKPTTDSETSSKCSECKIHTADSEYRLHYADPPPYRSTSIPDSRDGNVPLLESSGIATPSLHGADPLVVDILLEGRVRKRTDEDIERQLRNELAKEENATRKALVNQADRRGVTALHLCVAYGLEKTCRLLLEMGADTEARTAKRTCISHFAKPAERLAGEAGNIILYYRIMHCREYVERDDVPPVPTAKPKPKTEPKKRRMNVHGHTSPSSVANRRFTEFASKRARVASSSPSAAIRTQSQLGMTRIEDEIDRPHAVEPQFAEDFSFSPANTIHCNASTTDIQDFAKPTSVRRGVEHQNMHNSAVPPFLGDAHTVNGLYSSDMGSTIDFNHFGTPHVQTIQEQGIPANLNDDVASQTLPAAEPVQSTEADWRMDIADHAVSMAETMPLEPLPMFQGTAGAQEGPGRATQPLNVLQPAQQRDTLDNPDQEQSNYYYPITDPSQDVFGLPTSRSGNENNDLASVLMDFQPTFMYYHCIHDYPRNFETSYCPWGCLKVVTEPQYPANNV